MSAPAVQSPHTPVPTSGGSHSPESKSPTLERSAAAAVPSNELRTASSSHSAAALDSGSDAVARCALASGPGSLEPDPAGVGNQAQQPLQCNGQEAKSAIDDEAQAPTSQASAGVKSGHVASATGVAWLPAAVASEQAASAAVSQQQEGFSAPSSTPGGANTSQVQAVDVSSSQAFLSSSADGCNEGGCEAAQPQAMAHSSSLPAAAAAGKSATDDCSDSAFSSEEHPAAECSSSVGSASGEGRPTLALPSPSLADKLSHEGDKSDAAQQFPSSSFFEDETAHAGFHYGRGCGVRAHYFLPAPEAAALKGTESSSGVEQPAATGFFSFLGRGKQVPLSGPAFGPSVFATPKKMAGSLKTGLGGIAYAIAKKTLPKVFCTEARKDKLVAERPAAGLLAAEVCPCHISASLWCQYLVCCSKVGHKTAGTVCCLARCLGSLFALSLCVPACTALQLCTGCVSLTSGVHVGRGPATCRKATASEGMGQAQGTLM